MTAELKVPDLGESIREVRIAEWLKKPGDWVDKDEDLVEIESEKATVTVPAPEAGKVVEILVDAGSEAEVGDLIARIEPGSPPDKRRGKEEKKASDEEKKASDDNGREGGAAKRDDEEREKSKTDGRLKGQVRTRRDEQDAHGDDQTASRQRPSERSESAAATAAGPDARRALREHGLTEEEVAADRRTGDRLTRQDVQRFVRQHEELSRPRPEQAEPEKAKEKNREEAPPKTDRKIPDRPEEIVPMSPLRRRIAERLVAAQREAALLTTFNEIDMSAVAALRKKYGERFQEIHEARLGLMGFFVVATVDSLRDVPGLNAEVRGTDIAYKKYYDIGVAVGTSRGLVVPVMRGADRLDLASIERQIADLANRARENQLTPDELIGGTFTITNGGVFGSLLSTPIVNPPQTGILALHAIQDRPIAVDGQVVIRPMMYVSLTYDHRVVDGGQAVKFLRRIKERLEEPARMLLNV